MKNKALRYGYTTGACAAAAAKGAARILREQAPVDKVEIVLPTGELARFNLHGQKLAETSASCYVIKDSGDDPDVTNRAEIHASIDVKFFTKHQIILQGGVGIGRATKPGLAVPVGEWAINPVPRKMIIEGVKEVLSMRCMPVTFSITISIPNGVQLAKKTLNERLGIVGGLSILGTTGIVKPISAKAWTDTIDSALDVALACNCRTVVFSTGRSSEMAAQEYQRCGKLGIGVSEGIGEESYIMMGDHVGYALRAAGRKGAREVILAGQFAKLLKIASGSEQTHAYSSKLDLRRLIGWLSGEPGCTELVPLSQKVNTARQLLEDSGNSTELIELVCRKASSFAEKVAPDIRVKVLLAGYGGEVLYFG